MIKSALQSSLTNDIKYRSMSAGAVPSSEYLIQTYEVGATLVSSVTFENLAQYHGVYKHLQICMTPKSDRDTFANDAVLMYFNSDTTGTNYKAHTLTGGGTSGLISGVTSGADWFTSAAISDATSGIAASNNIYGAGVIDILDAFNATKNKTSRNLSGFVVSTTSIAGYSAVHVRLTSHLWMNTAPITTITLDQAGGSNFTSGSRFSLYGVTA